jgi:hypothetical protein
VEGERLEPAQIVGAAARLIDATDTPVATVVAVVGTVLVDPGAEASRAELEGITITPSTV